MTDTAPFYIDNEPEIHPYGTPCRSGYVRVMCYKRNPHFPPFPSDLDESIKEGILQIRNDIIGCSQTMTILAGARDPSDLNECIHIACSLGTIENMKVVIRWLAKQIEFELRGTDDSERIAFDRRYFLLTEDGNTAYDSATNDAEKAKILDSRTEWLRIQGTDTPSRHRTWTQLRDLADLSCHLELYTFKWHTDYAAKIIDKGVAPNTLGLEELKWHNKFSTGIKELPFVMDNFPETAEELCGMHVADMISSCKTPEELQERFSDIIGESVITPKIKYDYITRNFWLVGDDFVTQIVNELHNEDTPLMPWDIKSQEVIGIKSKVIETMKIPKRDPNDKFFGMFDKDSVVPQDPSVPRDPQLDINAAAARAAISASLSSGVHELDENNVKAILAACVYGTDGSGPGPRVGDEAKALAEATLNPSVECHEINKWWGNMILKARY
jgi:hypothetical protein